ncbi:PucR family transcriptional regulator [Rhodococcus sp. G-MC3]|uniref:PucR family transcriptional regulator n=1 Tax=Rhodococcus sp. G-MC3 TaxID=3046209 RepID=UPI0024BB748D|nr:PucR family transcriptional regulator [Rhodococcus sp. G-MC3]MDJ0392893.1 PucR family transcriptional regulator [Rhodococcus sp. G-MC3]
MTVSIAWLLGQQQLALERRGGPERAIREIQFVQPTELQDPSPWLSGGELVLTTGLDFSPAATGLTAYVERLDHANVAALAFGTGLSHAKIPDALIRAADQYGLPLLEVPLTTPFAAVTRAVMARLAEQDYEHVLRAATVQTRMTRSALRGGSSAVVRELALATSSAVALVGPRTSLVHPPDRRELPNEARAAIERSGAAPTGASITVGTPEHTLTLQSVGTGAGARDYLAVSSKGSLSNIDRILLGHAVSLLTMELEKSTRLRSRQSQLNTTALALLLHDSVSAESLETVLGDAADPDGNVRVLLLGADAIGAVEDHIESALASIGRNMFAQNGTEALTVLLGGTDDLGYVRGMLAGLPGAVRSSLRAGLSDIHPITDAKHALEEARLACDLATPQSPVRQFRALGEDTVLASQSAREVLLTIASTIVPVLAKYDGAHTGTLVTTLRTYLEMNGQWESAASRLGIHRHTLRARIARIEEVLECDLGQARVRAEILLALLAWDRKS